ncbi:alpha/beta fold hydrolase [Stakelama marina]|uniref:Alpha/beta fold hydrolase n=1 Tax=Stakelama marina TaxID=2826939 RepID=A0A8T4IEM9_9SPHN|nr:alpha/beta fold hydrolase [Stakelama marina]MBR0553097.1 alpha/beta fold hydrolase [Stakelama marina]
MTGRISAGIERKVAILSRVADETRLLVRSFFGPSPVALDSLPRGEGGGHCLVLPGFMACDTSMLPLRQGLNFMGYRTHRWKQGRNRGVDAQTLERIDARIRYLQRKHEAPIVLIGWSLGGIIAREYAKYAPERVGAVITLGSPLAGDLRQLPIARIYEMIAGHRVDQPPVECSLTAKPPVPTVALYSRRDEVVPFAHAFCGEAAADHNIEVDCLHLGYPSDARVMRVIDDAIRCYCPEAAPRPAPVPDPARSPLVSTQIA